MHLRSVIIAGVAAALLGSSAQAAGRFVNGSFEDGFEGWVTDESQVQAPGGAVHRDEFGDPDNEYDTIHGFRLAAMQADSTNTPVLLSQTFTTENGGVFSGWAAFLGEDFLPWNDTGFLRIYQLAEADLFPAELAPNPTELFYADISTVGDWGFTQWTKFSVALDPGTYRVEAGIIDVNDDRNLSVLILDKFQLTGVPEPSTWALMLAGFFGLGAALRRRRASLA